MERKDLVSEDFRDFYGDEPADEMEEYIRHQPASIEEFL